ncbi:MAG: anti-sigma-K factor RskA [Pseudoalteromonas distincta]|jgi:anti-sigma-K factor RskA
MSDTGPEMNEPEALAAEHALGVLSAPERAAAERRMAAEPAFAQAVDVWRRRLAPLVMEIAPVAPSDEVWPRIERALPVNDNNPQLARRLAFWRGATVGAMGLAAASLMVAVYLGNRPPVVIPAETPAAVPMLNASLNTEGGQPLFVASYDPVRQALIITSLVPPGTDPLHVHQVWLIPPEDGVPRSLGMVEPGTAKTVPLDASISDLAHAGTEIAVSVEPLGGSPQAGPSGPVAAVGALGEI